MNNVATAEVDLAAVSNEVALEVMMLEGDELDLRKVGQFEAASACQSLARALRLGQLSVRGLNNKNSRCRLFGRALVF